MRFGLLPGRCRATAGPLLLGLVLAWAPAAGVEEDPFEDTGERFRSPVLGTEFRVLRDPATGEKVEPGSVEHTIGDLVMAALGAGFALKGVDERAPDAEFAARYPRASKYVGWPMLVVLRLQA